MDGILYENVSSTRLWSFGSSSSGWNVFIQYTRESETIKASDCSFSNLLAGPKRMQGGGAIGNLVACEEWRQESHRQHRQHGMEKEGERVREKPIDRSGARRDSHPVKSWEWTCAQNEKGKERARLNTARQRAQTKGFYMVHFQLTRIISLRDGNAAHVITSSIQPSPSFPFSHTSERFNRSMTGANDI